MLQIFFFSVSEKVQQGKEVHALVPESFQRAVPAGEIDSLAASQRGKTLHGEK
jgi:hypothetical protein